MNEYKQEWINIGIFNPKGLKEINKRTRIENWAEHKGIKILGLAETQHAHTSKEGGTKKINADNVIKKNEYRWYFSSGIDPKKHDKKEKEQKRKG